MQSSLHTKEITTAQVASVSFGFFTDEEVSIQFPPLPFLTSMHHSDSAVTHPHPPFSLDT